MALTEGWYFEDIEIGQEFVSPGRTVTEGDIVTFAGLSGDFMPLHMSEEYAKSTIFGGRIAHGILGLSIASGLFTRTELAVRIQRTALAFLELQWRFPGPIRPGDTVTLTVRVTEKKETSRPDRGVLLIERTLRNQRAEVVQEGQTKMLISRRPA
ncbi:MAG: MaoC family dehydratase N-terminal domain-containing protein [Chloroflexi bacterium]|nr:MaoC family dehydratase N-terminal domain-containing protein [Chloroflexota bacterium]